MLSGMAGMGEVEELTPSKNKNNNTNNNNINTTQDDDDDGVDDVRTTTPTITTAAILGAPLLHPVDRTTTTMEVERQDATIPVPAIPATTERRRRKRRTRNRKSNSSPSDQQQQQQQPQQQTPYLRHKEQEIADILAQPVVDLWKLRALAISPGGLVNGTSN